MRILALTLAVTLALPPVSAVAGLLPDIHASALAYAANVQLGCDQALLEGSHAADDHAKGNGWLIGGILLPIIGLVALASNPAPPVELMATVQDEDKPCFERGYRQRASSNSKRKGLTGGAIGMAIGFVLIGAIGE